MRVVDDLERRGLAVRRNVPGDRRVRAVEITPEGVELFDAAHVAAAPLAGAPGCRPGARRARTADESADPVRPSRRRRGVSTPAHRPPRGRVSSHAAFAVNPALRLQPSSLRAGPGRGRRAGFRRRRASSCPHGSCAAYRPAACRSPPHVRRRLDALPACRPNAPAAPAPRPNAPAAPAPGNRPQDRAQPAPPDRAATRTPRDVPVRRHAASMARGLCGEALGELFGLGGRVLEGALAGGLVEAGPVRTWPGCGGPW